MQHKSLNSILVNIYDGQKDRKKCPIKSTDCWRDFDVKV